LKHQAALLELIVSEQRYYPDYYRVTFFGNFPGAVRGKSIIVRAPFIVTYLVAN
jgi:dedicator of cytokinesis protein 3